MTCAEGHRAANETSGTLKCVYDEVAGDVVLKGAVPKCWSVVCSPDDPSTGVRHECRDLSYKGSCMVTCKEGCEAGGNILTTFLLCLSSEEFVSETQTVDLSCSQMLSSDTPFQSIVGVNSSCEVVFIGDTCMVFCAEGYQVVSDETSVSTRVCHCWINSLCLFFGVCAQQEASKSQAVVLILHLDGESGDEAESPLVAERTSEPQLHPSDCQALTQRAVRCL